MTYLKSKNYDGIMYPSARIDYAKIKGWPPYNYAFPAQVSSEIGYCRNLTDKFFWTNPVVLGTQNQFEYAFSPNEISNLTDNAQIEIEGKYIDYTQTLYATIVSNLFTEEFLKEKESVEAPHVDIFRKHEK
ncbi:MAG TPA: hypothetical protein VK957_13280 [Lunatimonas sp.]|nr:hypothetical protein [Lunatimonas sp.]